MNFFRQTNIMQVTNQAKQKGRALGDSGLWSDPYCSVNLNAWKAPQITYPQPFNYPLQMQTNESGSFK